MALTDAMYTGVSGLSVNQTWLNVIGNNIANSNTTAFKSSQALFNPEFYVTDANGTAPDTTFGGTNPSQIGLGATVATVEKNFTGGQIQATGKATDMAISGDGFFVVKGQQQLYTRDGSFNLNSSNQLVDSSGNFVQGFTADSSGRVNAGTLSDLTIPLGAQTLAKATQNATMQGNLDASGGVATGASILLSQDLTTVGGAAAPTATTALTSVALAASPATPAFTNGQVITLAGTKGGRTLAASTFTVTTTSTLGDLSSFLQEGMGIDTTVPATTPPPGVTLEAGTAADTAHLVITGNEGTDNALEISGSGLTSTSGAALSFADGTDAAGIASDPNGASVHTSIQVYDSLGTPVNIDVTAVLESQSTTGNTWRYFATTPDNTAGGSVLGNGTLTFNTSGILQSTTGTPLNINRSGTGASSPLAVSLNFGQLTSLSGQSSLTMSTQDGFAIGTLDSFSVGADGTLTGAFSNGQTRVLGQVALARFANPGGLVDQGSNLYAVGAGSGAAQVAAPGQAGVGTIQGAALEQSNVDLSTEFTNMIVASTGFSAASKVITTSDQLIQQLLNITTTA
jgi:flagellar hook protein FlgE